MSTEPKESEDVFAFITANPDKLAKAPIQIPGSFQIYARNGCSTEMLSGESSGLIQICCVHSHHVSPTDFQRSNKD